MRKGASQPQFLVSAIILVKDSFFCELFEKLQVLCNRQWKLKRELTLIVADLLGTKG